MSRTSGAIWANWSAPDARHPDPVFGLRYGDHNRVQEIPFDDVTGEIVELELQIAAIVRSVADGTPPPTSGDDGRWSVRLCLAAQASVDAGTPIRIDEVR